MTRWTHLAHSRGYVLLYAGQVERRVSVPTDARTWRTRAGWLAMFERDAATMAARWNAEGRTPADLWRDRAQAPALAQVSL